MKILSHDGGQFVESTILDISRGPQKQIPIPEIQQAQKATEVIELLIGYRVYFRQGNKNDEIGNYSGWSSEFDEVIPLYTPRIQPKLAFEVGQGDLEFVKYLLKKEGVDSQIKNNKKFDDSLLIHNACQGGKAEIAEYLIQNQIYLY
eukprot:403351528